MKKILESLGDMIAIAIAVAVGFAIVVPLIQTQTSKVGTFGGGSQEARFNKISDLNSVATSTGSFDLNPVLVLPLDASRRYAKFQNNSAVDVWLVATSTTLDLTGTGHPRAATSSITTLNGVLLEAKKAGAPVSTWVLDTDNMVYGNIYATSTAATDVIVNYK